MSLGSLGGSSIVHDALWVALEVVEGVLALLLALVGSGADLGVCWVAGLLAALLLRLWGLTTLVRSGHFDVLIVVRWESMAGLVAWLGLDCRERRGNWRTRARRTVWVFLGCR